MQDNLDNQGTPKFPLGKIYITRAAGEILHPGDVAKALWRHVCGDWGLVDPEDAKENDLALIEGRRLLSAYEDRDFVTFWIITEWDRSVTTILLPEDY